MKSPASIPGNTLTPGGVYTMRTWSTLTATPPATHSTIGFVGYFDAGRPLPASSVPPMNGLVPGRHTCIVIDSVTRARHTIHAQYDGRGFVWAHGGKRVTFDR